MKNTTKFSILTILIAMSACARGGSGPSVGQFAKPTGTAAKLQTCAEKKLSTQQPYVGENITVCRRDDGQVVRKEIPPSFYISGRKKRVHVDQVIGVSLLYSGTAPGKDLAGKDLAGRIENSVNRFLMTKCAPKFQKIFHRSGLNSRFVFQTFLDSDSLADGEGSVGDREPLFGQEQNRPVNLPINSPATLADPKKQVGVDPKRLSPNFRLELLVDANEGISIFDALKPVSSGSLKAKDGNEEQQNRFCAQLLVRIGENMGLGGLAVDDKTCDEAADQGSEHSPEPTKTEPMKTEAAPDKAPEKTSVQKGPIGIMKSGAATPAEFVSTKLAPAEIETILAPICGPLETLPNAPKTSQK